MFQKLKYETLWAIRCYLYNFLKGKIPWRSVTLSKVAKACNFIKSNTPPLMFFTFLKLYKWHQIAESIIYDSSTDSEPNTPFFLYKQSKI